MEKHFTETETETEIASLEQEISNSCFLISIKCALLTRLMSSLAIKKTTCLRSVNTYASLHTEKKAATKPEPFSKHLTPWLTDRQHVYATPFGFSYSFFLFFYWCLLNPSFVRYTRRINCVTFCMVRWLPFSVLASLCMLMSPRTHPYLLIGFLKCQLTVLWPSIYCHYGVWE